MTALPEAKLAREAEICYAVIGCVTDYDSWHQQRDAVTVDVILNTLARNVDTAKKMIKIAVARIGDTRDCECATALKTALVTAPESMPPAQRKKLGY
jgi:5'-methylthioadenosine phosphorylase